MRGTQPIYLRRRSLNTLSSFSYVRRGTDTEALFELKGGGSSLDQIFPLCVGDFRFFHLLYLIIYLKVWVVINKYRVNMLYIKVKYRVKYLESMWVSTGTSMGNIR